MAHVSRPPRGAWNQLGKQGSRSAQSPDPNLGWLVNAHVGVVDVPNKNTVMSALTLLLR